MGAVRRAAVESRVARLRFTCKPNPCIWLASLGSTARPPTRSQPIGRIRYGRVGAAAGVPFRMVKHCDQVTRKCINGGRTLDGTLVSDDQYTMRAAERAHWPQSGVEERGRGRQRHVGPLRMLALVKLLSNAICMLGVEKVCCQPRAGVIGGRPAIRGVRRGLPNCFTFHRARKQPLRAMRKEGCAQRVYVRSMCEFVFVVLK